MKKPAMKWVIVTALILLVGYSSFATYNWLERQRLDNGILNSAIALSDLPLAELSSVGGAAEYSIEHDTAGELLSERITRYIFHVRTLSYSSGMLHALTGDEKYRTFETAMINLTSFFSEINNKPDIEEILAANLDTFRQIDDTFEETQRLDALTPADAEELFELSGNLTAGWPVS